MTSCNSLSNSNYSVALNCRNLFRDSEPGFIFTGDIRDMARLRLGALSRWHQHGGMPCAQFPLGDNQVARSGLRPHITCISVGCLCG
jgi:hypothetical protein